MAAGANRTAPSDARQGQIIAGILDASGIERAALTYTNIDHGKGLADSIQSSFEGMGARSQRWMRTRMARLIDVILLVVWRFAPRGLIPKLQGHGPVAGSCPKPGR